MNSDSRMSSEKLSHLLGLMCREVVGDDVNFPSPRLRGNDLREESNELRTGVSSHGAAENLAGSGIEGSIQRQGPVTEVLEAMTFRSSGGQRQNRVVSVEGLNGSFLVNAEDSGMLRRVHVKANDISSFLLEVRVIGRHVSFEAMRAQTSSFPYPSHHHVADSKMFREFARSPMRRASRRTLPSPLQDPSFQGRRTPLHLTTRMKRKQTRESVFLKPLLPAADITSIASQSIDDRGIGATLSKTQDQLRSPNVSGGQCSGASPPAQLLFLVRLQCESQK